MVGSMEVEELVGNDIVLQFLPQLQEQGVKGQPARACSTMPTSSSWAAR